VVTGNTEVSCIRTGGFLVNTEGWRGSGNRGARTPNSKRERHRERERERERENEKERQLCIKHTTSSR
jgi:hypothetical protein